MIKEVTIAIVLGAVFIAIGALAEYKYSILLQFLEK